MVFLKDYIMKKLGICSKQMKKLSVYQFIKQVKDKLLNSFLQYWKDYRYRILNSEQGKLYTYFSFKTTFGCEKY